MFHIQDDIPKEKAHAKSDRNAMRKLCRDRQLLCSLLSGKWVKTNTAILVYHGVGRQNPLETLDAFARGITEAFRDISGARLSLEHGLTIKQWGDKEMHFENYIRITKEGSPFHIDVYEYYWAHETTTDVRLKDIQHWVSHTIKGARKFYKQNETLGKLYGDRSIFFNQVGKLRRLNYWIFLTFISRIIPFFYFLFSSIVQFLSIIPGIGFLFGQMMRQLNDSIWGAAAALVSDIVIYNSRDPQSKFYKIRRKIINGSVKAISSLIEPKTNGLAYGQVFLAGHSLGSQIAFDSINRINRRINRGLMAKVDCKGYYQSKWNQSNVHVAQVLSGFITFGSPLDKTAFFLRSLVDDEAYIRSQLLHNYHCFKQRNWTQLSQNRFPYSIAPSFVRLFEEMEWRNYFDEHDYVSGNLDFYHKLTNIDCQFKTGTFSFSHSNYWKDPFFYADLIQMITAGSSVPKVR